MCLNKDIFFQFTEDVFHICSDLGRHDHFHWVGKALRFHDILQRATVDKLPKTTEYTGWLAIK